MAVWWEAILDVLITIGVFILTVLSKSVYILSVQFLNLGILWQLLPIYTSWFAVEFITRNREEQDVSNRFMNSFSSLWVAFQLGEYIIQNITKDPYIIIKIIAVAGSAAYAIFLMRLVFLRKSITKQLARVGEISSINIALMLLVQNQLIIRDPMDIIYTLLGFLVIYFVFDFVIFKLIIERIYKKIKVPEEEEEKKEEIKIPTETISEKPITIEPEKPRYERIIKPVPVKPLNPIPLQPSTIGKPVTPINNTQANQGFKPTEETSNKPVNQGFKPIEDISKPIAPAIKKVEIKKQP